MEERFLAGRKKAMSLLQHNDRTEWELRDKLKRAGFEDDVIEDAITYVYSFHYLDDRRYAVRFAEIYSAERSIQRIRQDLQKRHIDSEIIDYALESISWDDSEALKKAIRKLFLSGSIAYSEMNYEEKQKVVAKLYRKGFSLERIYAELEAM